MMFVKSAGFNYCFSSFLNSKFFENLVRFTYSRQFRMDLKHDKTVYFHNDEGDDKLHVQINVQNESPHINKIFMFERKMSESVQKFLDKLNGRVMNKFNKKGEKLDSSFSDSHFFLDDESVQGDTVFKDVFQKGCERNLKLRLLGCDYLVRFNYPMVEELKLPDKLKVGCPVVPKKLKVKCTNECDSHFMWFKRIPKFKKWIQCGEGYSYVPMQEDLHHYLKLVCTPKRGALVGSQHETISQGPIEEFEFGNLLNKRIACTENQTEDNEVRIVSYNVLADTHTSTKEAKSTLFTYCKHDILDFNYRMGLIFMELNGYNADLICLQEIEAGFFKSYLSLFLKNKGYNGIFHNKERSKEGCVSFYKRKKFSMLSGKQYIFWEELNENPIFTDLKKKVIDNHFLIKRLSGLQNQIQISVLECLTKTNNFIVLGNTHLFFHPDADHIRLLHGIMGFMLLLETVKEVKNMNPGKEVSIIYCGDFNSTPDCGVYKFLTEGSVDSNEQDWKSTQKEEIKNVSFKHTLKMKSACGTPDYTNYTELFKGCLDYIFYQSSALELKCFVPFPSVEELSKEVAIPSSYYPSDHVALIADLKWRT